MKTMKTIWFDMDGTLGNLYAVEGWLSMLRAYDPTPYEEAGVMLNMSLLARYLNRLQEAGYQIGIISWLSKCPTPEYDEAVTAAKLVWLKKHLRSVSWDAIRIVAYGTPKSSFMENDDDILFDDEAPNREEWKGEAYEPSQILEILKGLLKGE
jgi:phosphoglycolate phosphatase-like HAD superfamily hydrolase